MATLLHQLIQFFHMGGYAIYVWPAYFIALIVLGLNVYLPLRKQHDILLQLKKQQLLAKNHHASHT